MKIAALLSICDKDVELANLWTSARMGRVVNKCLSDHIRNTFWEAFEPFKAKCYESRTTVENIPTPMDTWEAVFDKHYSSARITFLLNFLELRLSILRNMGVGIGKKKGKKDNEVKNHLLGVENWKCPICQTKHGNDKRPVRPYLSCCEAFKKLGVPQMIQACKKYNFCQVCTSSKDDKIHKESTNGCPRKETFKCKQCPEPKCFTHCDLLCISSSKGKRGKAGKPDGGGGGSPRGGGGGTGNPPGSGSGGASGGVSGNGGCPGGACHNNLIVPYQTQGQSYGAKTWPVIPVLKTQNQGNQDKTDAWKIDGWLLWRNYFQPVILGTIVTRGPHGCVHCLVLSDSGSSIAFCDSEFMEQIGLKP